MHHMDSSLQIDGHAHRPTRWPRRGWPRSSPTPASACTSPTTCSSVEWTPDAGLARRARSRRTRPLSLDPATAVLHYAQEIFEGMKAYRHADGSVWTFRPEENARADGPRPPSGWRCRELPVEDFIASVDALVQADERWVPEAAGEKSLYLRPFMFASEVVPRRAALPARHLPGDRLARRRLLRQGRSSRSRSGSARTTPAPAAAAWARPRPAATTPARWSPQQEAIAEGCDQVVFLDAAEGRYVEELGGMNLYFVHDDGTIVTPATSGTILEGITRSSIIELCGKLGHQVEERRVHHRRVARRRRVRADHRGVRLRHRRGRDPGRRR